MDVNLEYLRSFPVMSENSSGIVGVSLKYIAPLMTGSGTAASSGNAPRAMQAECTDKRLRFSWGLRTVFARRILRIAGTSAHTNQLLEILHRRP
jgi:hypothetical protein